MNDKIRIFALGGLDEEGKNLLVLEINGDIFVIECGVMVPDKTMPGVDYVIPQYDYLVEHKDKIKAYFLLHGHDDEIGALAYIYPQAPAPIYGSKVTLTMLQLFTQHVKKDPSMYDLHEVAPTSTFMIAGREINFFHTAHNIADSSGLAIATSYGNIVYTGDFVIENSASASYLNDMNAIARIAEKPTLALLSESMYSSRPGYTAPLYKLTSHISEIFKSTEGRIFVSLSSTNLFNVDEIINLTVLNKKKLICYDAATLSMLKAMQAAGSTKIPTDNFASLDDILRLRDQDIVVLMTGFGSRLFHKIALLASSQNEDRRIKLKPTDHFIVASTPNDNTEIDYTDAADELFRTGAHITLISKKHFVKMHASEEDLKMMASILKPKYYIPVKGFYKDLLHNAMLSLSMGISLTHRNVFVIENGISVLIDENGGRIFDEKITHGDLMIDGSGVGDVSKNVLEDRQKLADGIVLMAITIDPFTKTIAAGPDVQMRGFLVQKEADILNREVTKVFIQTVEEFLGKPNYSLEEMRQNVYERCLRLIRRLTSREPMVVPLIVERS